MGLLLILITLHLTDNPLGGNLTVEVHDVRDMSGVVVVALFTDEKTFLKKPVLSKRVSPKGESVTVVFGGIPPGEYGISVFHDRNENGELDVNRIGIPTEGFAFGNDAMGLFGPPSFKKATVRVSNENVNASVNLRYF